MAVMHLGIDPGLKGGLALLDDSGRLAWSQPIPVVQLESGRKEIDEGMLKDKLQFATALAGGRLVAHLEKVGAMPKQGVVSMFSFGAGWGMVRGLLCALGIRYDLPTPQAWKKLVMAGQPKGSEVLVACRLWGRGAFMFGQARNPNDGVVDAALIAEAGRRTWKGDGDVPK